MKPLFLRHFRAMKWFLIAFVLVSALASISIVFQMEYLARVIYSGEMMDTYFASRIGYTFGEPLTMLLTYAAVLSVLMALFQQYDAMRLSGAQMMASFPVKRGKDMAMQLMLGSCCILTANVIFGASAIISYFARRDIIDLGFSVSPLANFPYRIMSVRFLLLMSMRVFLIALCAYMLTTAIAGLFGNIFFAAAFMGGLWMMFMAAMAAGGAMMDSVRFLLQRNMDSPRLAIRGLYWVETNISGWYYDILNGGRQVSSGIFVFIHLSLAAALAYAAVQMKKRLQIEKLGGVFLFNASRYAVIAYIGAWPLGLALCLLTTYGRFGERVYNRAFPAALSFAIFVLLIAWYLIAKRPARRRAKAVLAMLLVPFTLAPCAANADQGYKMAFDASQIAFDKAAWEKADPIALYLSEREMRDELEHDGIEVWEDTLSLLEALANVGTFYEFSESHNQYDFTIDVRDASKCVLELKAVGLHEIAGAIAGFSKGREKRYADGFWLTLYSDTYYEWEGEEENSYITVYIDVDLPFMIKGDAAAKCDTALRGDERIQRRRVFANGTYETLSYTMHTPYSSTDEYIWIPGAVVNAVMKDDALRYLTAYLERAAGYSSAPEDLIKAATHALEAAASADQAGEADVKAAIEDISSLVRAGRTGKGTAGKLMWRVDEGIMVQFGN